MPYIFIHGLMETSSSWDKTFSHMEKSRQVIAPDLFILLNSKEVTYKNLYQAFSDYCNSFSEPLNLCGLSLGGILALNYTIDHPTRVQSLVLIGSPYKMPKTLLKFQNTIFSLMPKSAFKNLQLQKQDFIQLMNSMISLDFSSHLKEIPCPTLIICGEKDAANKKAATGLAKNIPNAKLQFVKNAGHEVSKKNPQDLASKLEIFYKK